MLRPVRIALAVSLAALVVPAAASASVRMPIGFQDDPTFRWNGDVAAELDKAAEANATIIRATADWRAIAPTKPRSATNSFDPAYHLNDLDDLVRLAQQRGIQVMITIWGSPKWSNPKGPNTVPRRLADLTQFARALADRYSGRHPGFPYVGHYSVWNEPNLGIFLEPQFDAKGRPISPRLYAAIYKAAYAGIKAGNRTAKVAIGETSNLGRDHPKKGVNDSTAPGTFARLLSQQKGLRFDAYAEHPYATRPNLPPTQKVHWPNVTMTQLKKFETSLNSWFHRTVPVWITEYGYETKPAEPAGVTNSQQAAYMSKVVRQLRADPQVQMFIWFIFRDSKTSLWQSGLYTASGAQKPAYRTFSSLAALIGGETVPVRAGVPPLITLAVPRLAYASAPGETIGVTYFVSDGGKVVGNGYPAVPLRPDGTVQFVAQFTPEAGKTYQIQMDAQDSHGNHAVRTYALVAPMAAKAGKSTTTKR
ncbi:MAG TPA: cellulase family glycosylhydrolase [Gaiellaceae bacterium]|nr:cellulase family glycosylhydrolase [Gaiellaceae bacterium]